MALKKIVMIMYALVLLFFFIGVFLYSQMPDKMASHWNIQGQVDSYMPKFWGLFLLPFVSLGLSLLFLAIPKIDPLKGNIEKFRNYYDHFAVLIILFFLYIYLLTVFWNLGFRFRLLQFMIPAIGFLFYYAGILTENAKRNWFVGIRTPWTLSSERVWNKTHEIGGRLFKIAGVIVFFGLFFIDYAIFFVIIPIFMISGYLIVYSYVEYQKEVNDR